MVATYSLPWGTPIAGGDTANNVELFTNSKGQTFGIYLFNDFFTANDYYYRPTVFRLSPTGTTGAGAPTVARTEVLGRNYHFSGSSHQYDVSPESVSISGNLFGGATIAMLGGRFSPGNIGVNEIRISILTEDLAATPFTTTIARHAGSERSNVEIVTLADGGHVVSWTESNRDGSGLGVFYQKLDATGELVGATKRLTAGAAGDQWNAELAARGDGGFVSVYSNLAADGSGRILLQRHDADGKIVSDGNIVVARNTAGALDHPQVAVLNNGRIAVVWENATDGTVWLRMFSDAGAALGNAVRVGNVAGHEQRGVMVKTGAGNTVHVSWSDEVEISAAQYAGRAFYQRFDASGNALGPATGLQTYTYTSDPDFPLLTHKPIPTEIILLPEGGVGVVARDGSIRYFGQGTDLNDTHVMSSAGRFDGYDGNDAVVGSAGNDSIFGGRGADTLFGGGGNDHIETGKNGGQDGGARERADGGAGNDTLIAQAVAELDGGDGDDVIIGSATQLKEGVADLIYGGAGHDLIRTRHGTDIAYGGDGNDTIRSNGGNDSLYGGAGADRLAATGGDGEDEVVLLDGGAGADRLLGSGGTDMMYGGTGNDTLEGRGGDDHLWGGAGNDTFLFRAEVATTLDGAQVTWLNIGNDILHDWQDGSDRIRVMGMGASFGFGDLTIADEGPHVVVTFVEDSSTLTILGAAGLIGIEDFQFIA